MNLPSLKKTLLLNYAELAITDEIGTNNLILITAAGIIIGKVVMDDPEDQDISPDNVMSKISLETATQYRIENGLDKDKPLTGNDGFICLKDVQIISGVKTINLPFLTVFVEDVIAATLGKIS